MIGELGYILIGFVIATITITVITYYDFHDENEDDAVGFGILGLVITLFWPLASPIIIFSGLAYYVSNL